MESLELVDFETSPAAIVSLFPRLSSIHVVGQTSFPSSSGTPDLPSVVAGIASLRHLVLEGEAPPGTAFKLGPEWSALRWDTQLTSLELYDFSINKNSAAFVEIHAPELRHLTLESPYFSNSLALSSTSFPHLQSLQLSNLTLDTCQLVLAAVCRSAPRGSPSPLFSLSVNFRRKTASA